MHHPLIGEILVPCALNIEMRRVIMLVCMPCSNNNIFASMRHHENQPIEIHIGAGSAASERHRLAS